MIHTSMTLAQVDTLEEVFAVPLSDGYSMQWVIPEWLNELRKAILFSSQFKK